MKSIRDDRTRREDNTVLNQATWFGFTSKRNGFHKSARTSSCLEPMALSRYYLSPYYDDVNLRANSFQEGENDVNLSDKSVDEPMPMLLDEPIGLMLNPMCLDADRRQTWVTMVCWAEAEN